ncbi:TetR/AcrR family transcriptional regulator [Saccharothrix sp. Mg75]|uniref:TetR/AcrR family transcriptional regulator n=1 Tax=Saccharothrix sp. Mg75 TaxID=3445357 RepID=UPI003EEC3510
MNTIAKRMGVTGPALYRYFAGRDDLPAEPVRDAWHDLADAVEAAAAAGEGAVPADRVRAFGEAFRTGGVTQPHRYLLLSVLPRPPSPPPGAADESTLDGQLRAWARSRGEGDAPPAVLLTGLRAFTRLHGVLSLEVTGRFGPMGLDPALLYRAEVESLILGDSGVRGFTRLSGPG